jgi:hypothetical protein
MSDDLWGFFLAVGFVAAGLAMTALGACDVDAGTADSALADAGFGPVTLGGHAWLACREPFASHFTALNAAAVRVDGVLCCDWLRHCSVKF